MRPLRSFTNSQVITAFFLLAALALAIYWPGLHGDFLFDDGPNILFVPGIKMESLTWDGLRQAWFSGGAGPFGRPIAQLSFGLNYYFSGFSAFSFKLTNLVIHFIAAILVYLLSCRVIEIALHTSHKGNGQITSLVIAATWLLHPIQMLTVLHVVQRMTSLSTLFILVAIYLHVQGREIGGSSGLSRIFVGWFLFWPLSVLSKETGLLFPAFALVWELSLRRVMRGYLDNFARIFIAMLTCSAVVIVLYMCSSSGHWIWAGYDFRAFTASERLMTEARVLWVYIGMIVYPRLSAFALYHDDIVISQSLISPITTLIAILGLLALIAAAWRIRAKYPCITFGVAWFLVGHLMESTVLPLEIAHEHRNHLPFAGLLFASLGLWRAVLKEADKRTKPLLALLSIAGLAGLLVTGLRTLEFSDDVRRTQMEVAYHPESARAQYEAGSVLASLPVLTTRESELYPIARAHLESSMRLDKNFKLGGLALVYLSCKTGQIPESKVVRALADRLGGTPFAPGDRSVLFNLKEMSLAGTLCLQREEVASIFNATIANDTIAPTVRGIVYSWYADYLWLVAKDLQAARDALSESLLLDPTNSSNRLKWAQLLYLSGERQSAAAILLELQAKSMTLEEIQTIKELLQAINMGS